MTSSCDGDIAGYHGRRSWRALTRRAVEDVTSREHPRSCLNRVVPTRPRWLAVAAAGAVAMGCGDSKATTADAGAGRDAGRDAGLDASATDAGEDGGSVADAGDLWPIEDGVRGLRFDPETPALEGGVANVDPWLARYDEEDVRQAVLTELRSVRRTARLSAVTLVMSQIDVVRGRALGGYWIWQYKPGSGLEGIREAGHVSVDAAGWDAAILDVLVSDDRP